MSIMQEKQFSTLIFSLLAVAISIVDKHPLNIFFSFCSSSLVRFLFMSHFVAHISRISFHFYLGNHKWISLFIIEASSSYFPQCLFSPSLSHHIGNDFFCHFSYGKTRMNLRIMENVVCVYDDDKGGGGAFLKKI